MRWIRMNDRLPERGTPVLIWSEGAEPGYGLARFEEDGRWTDLAGRDAEPSYWVELPDAPGTDEGTESASDIRGEITDGRIALDIRENKEAVALMMQRFIDGGTVTVGGSQCFVTDMKNEVIDGRMMSVFYVREE